MTPREFNISIPQGTVAAMEWGDAGSPSVLALHGWLDNAASFSSLAKRFVGFHVVAVDLPGHGKSAHRSVDASYSFSGYVADVLSIVEALQWSQYSLVGHSLGAGIASLVAVVNYKLIENLVLIDGIGPLSEPSADAPERLRRSMQRRLRKPIKKKLIYANIEQAIEARQEAGDLSIDSTELLVRRGTESVDGGIRWRCDPRLLLPSPVYMTEDQVLAMLSAIQSRTLLIQARTGALSRNTLMKERIKSVPDLSVVELSGGHHLHMENPGPTAEAILDFLNVNKPL